jgi:hypothetical protein
MTGCGVHPHLQPTKTEYRVVMPEDKYFSGCDVVSLPDPATLTNTQVAQLIVDLATVNKVCHNNNKAIHDYLIAAQKELAKKNSAVKN